MPEFKLDQLSPKSQKSRFRSVLVGEANALASQFRKKDISVPLEVLESYARSNVAHKGYENRLRKETETDPLTGALSRKGIFRGIGESLAEIERKGGTIQVVFMDLKGLKQFNDQYSHEAGDMALRYLVKGVKECIRQYDEIGRYGGDEFILLLKEPEKPVVDTIMSRLHTTLSQLEQPYNGIRTVVGVANHTDNTELETAEHLIHRADQAFYYAKRHNIDTPVNWDPSMKFIKVPK